MRALNLIYELKVIIKLLIIKLKLKNTKHNEGIKT
jgi:hypothetical protein